MFVTLYNKKQSRENNLSHLRVFSIIFMAATLIGCSTSGGTIGGLFPAPKFLKGEIKSNIYTAQDKSFSVKIPHNEGTYEYTYMQVKEQYNEYGAYISFGPAALNQSIYRLEIGKRLTPESQNINFDDAAQKVVDEYKTQLEKAYGTSPKVVIKRPDIVNSKKALYWNMTQVVPAGKYASDKDVTLTHDIYVIDFSQAAIVAWVQVPDINKAPLEPLAFAESIVAN